MRSTILLGILIFLNSCITDRRLNRPDLPLCINLGDDLCACSYKEEDYIVECVGYISTDLDSYEEMEKYVDSIELRLLNCLNTPKKCK